MQSHGKNRYRTRSTREEITNSSAMAERPRELDPRFEGVDQFEAKF